MDWKPWNGIQMNIEIQKVEIKEMGINDKTSSSKILLSPPPIIIEKQAAAVPPNQDKNPENNKI